MSTYNIDPIIYNGVATIGRKYIIPKVIGTVIWFFTDDEGQLHKKILNNVLYFTDSLVNIISANTMAESMRYHEGTWELAKRNIIYLHGILGSIKIQ